MTIETVSYKQFVDRIIEMMYGNNNMRYDIDIFKKEGNKIGKEIYKVGGANGLFDVMHLVEQEFLNCEYSNEYLGVLREIEWSWCGICEEWQA